MTNEWLAAAEKALEDALDDPVRTGRLLKVAQVHALIAIGQEIAGIRELIVITEVVEDGPVPADDDEEGLLHDDDRG